MQPPSQRLLFMIWIEPHVCSRVPFSVCHLGPTYGVNMPKVRLFRRLTLSVSFLISQSFFRCCCGVLGVACYGVKCLCLWWEVSPVGSSWLRSFLQVLFLFMDAVVWETLYFSFRHLNRNKYHFYDGGDTRSATSVSNQNSLDWNRKSCLTYLTFPCEVTAELFFFFLIPANKITNNFYISWFGVNHTLVIDYIYHWGELLAIKHQVLCPGLCEPFHSCLFEVYYLSQATKFRPFNVNEALWLSGSGRLLLQSLLTVGAAAEWSFTTVPIHVKIQPPRLGN